GGTIDMSQYTGNNTDKGTGMIYLYGNINVSSPGLITETQNSYGAIYFVNSGGIIQTYDLYSRVTNNINYIINSGAIVDCSTRDLTSDGTFTLMAGGGLMIGSPQGITRTSMQGNIQVT